MAQQENRETATLIAGALDWWREAGVDCAYVDDPVRWIVERETPAEPTMRPERRQAAEPSPATREVGTTLHSVTAQLPESLEHFTQWWMTEVSLAEGALATRVPPRGRSGAELMVIVPEPEESDTDRLLSGPQGRLLDAMLASFGIATENVYFASALARHLPGADWDDLAARGIGAVMARHVALAAPRRLAVFGSSILPLIGNDPPQGPADLRFFNHENMRLPLLAGRSLAALLEQPRWKAKVWQAWLDWSG